MPKEKRKQRKPGQLRSIKALDDGEKFRLLKMYNKIRYNYHHIATEFNVNYRSLKLFVQGFYVDMVNSREVRHLRNIETYRGPHLEYLPPDHINEAFLKLLSEPKAKQLSQAEVLYCHLLVESKNQQIAIQHSGLTAGLRKSCGNRSKGSHEYNAKWQQLCYLRAKFVENKPNVKGYLKFIREQYDGEVAKSTTKESLIAEWVCYLEAAKQAGCTRSQAKALENLGKLKGAYVEKVQVQELVPPSAYDGMIKMARERREAIEAQEVLPLPAPQDPQETQDPQDDSK